MAKKKEIQELKDWIEVDGALKRLAEIDIETTKIEGKMTLAIMELKEGFTGRVTPLNAERKNLVDSITAFADERKAEFVKIRTRELNFGTISYRASKKLQIRSNKATIAALKALGMAQFLHIEETPDKEKLDVLSDTELVKLGVERKSTDVLKIEPNIEKIKAQAGG